MEMRDQKFCQIYNYSREIIDIIAIKLHCLQACKESYERIYYIKVL
jgi:hypothetical protein